MSIMLRKIPMALFLSLNYQKIFEFRGCENLVISYFQLQFQIQFIKTGMAEEFSIQAFIFVIILLMYLLTSHVIQTKRIPYIHESTIAVVMGMFTAFFAKYGLGKQIQFSNEIFFALILPSIIFSAGYNVRKSGFFQHFKIITFLGIIGTLVEFVCLAVFIHFINDHLFKVLSLKDVMLLSCVLCATDTVTSMSLIKRNKFPVLSTILFGEAIFNDAVSIILFHSISEIQITDEDGVTFLKLALLIFDFTYMFAFSVAFGAAAGFGLSYLFKKFQSFGNYPIKEVSLILLNGYFTYLMGQLLGLSGIIALFTCAITMGHYCYLNISQSSRSGTELAFDTVSYVAEAFIFAYLGTSILQIQGKWFVIIISIMLLVFIPIVRAVVVLMGPLLFTITRQSFPLSNKQIKMCWFSGMTRGAIAFALCLQIEGPSRKLIVSVVLIIVLISTLLSSTMLRKFKKLIGISGIEIDHAQKQLIILQSQNNPTSSKRINFNQKHSSIANMEKANEEQSLSGRPIKSNFQMFQQNILKSILQKNNKKPQIAYQMTQRQNKLGASAQKQRYGNIQEI